MKKSFTRLLSLVMLFSMLCMYSFGQTASTCPTPDYEDLRIKKVMPLGDDAYTKTTEPAVIIFNEAVVASTGSIRVFKDDALVAVIAATDPKVTINDKTVTINLSAYQGELKWMKVSVDANAFKPALANSTTVFTTIEWCWQTGDYTKPVLESVVPKDNAIVDDDEISLVLGFKDASTVSKGSGNITVYKADGNVWQIVNINDISNVPVKNLTDNLWYLTVPGIRQLQDKIEYQVTVDKGFVTDEGKTTDDTKNEFAGSYDRTKWSFTTLDFTAPEWEDGYPDTENVTADGFDVLIKTKESGKAYVFVSPSSSVPTVGYVRQYGESVDVTGGEVARISFDGKEEETPYYVFAIVDNDDVPASEVKMTDVTTGETDDPVLQYVNYYDEDENVQTAYTVSENVLQFIDDVDRDIQKVRIYFDEKIKIGAGSIVIKRVKDNSVFATIPSSLMTVGCEEVMPSMQGMNALKSNVIDNEFCYIEFPLTGIENDMDYYVQIPGTLVFDMFGNNYGGMATVTAWRFRADDTIPPTYTIVPAHAAQGVKKDANIVITFSESVNTVTTDYYITDGNGATVAHVFDHVDNGVNSVVTLNPYDAVNPAVTVFTSSDIVSVIIKNSNITDKSGNTVLNPVDAGQNSSTSFKVEDYRGPVVDAWSTGTVSSNTALSVRYKEAIYLLGGGEINSGNLYTIVTVKEDNINGVNIPVNLSISSDKKTITITPVDKWKSSGVVYVAISTEIEDMYGNDFDTPTASAPVSPSKPTYNVVDYIAEKVVFNITEASSISTLAPITLKFDDQARTSVYNGIDGNGSAVYSNVSTALMQKVIILKEDNAQGKDVPFGVSTTDNKVFNILTGGTSGYPELESNKTYYLAIGASTKDASANGGGGNLNIPNAVTFKTFDEDAPYVKITTPATDEENVAINAAVTVTYNTDIAIGTISTASPITISDGTTTTSVTVANLVVSGSTLTIKHADFAPNKEYTISIAADAIVNKNALSTSSVAYSWSFKTVDKNLDIVSLTPDNVIDVLIDDNLKIVFGEDVVPGIGYVTIKNYLTNGVVERIATTSSQVSIVDETVTINPTANLKFNTKYYVEVNPGAFKDASGNGNKEVAGKTESIALTSWTFFTENQPLMIVKVTPDNEEDKVALASSIVVEFNRPIAIGSSGSVGYIEVNPVSGALTPQLYPINSSQLDFSGNILTISHSDKQFPANSKIWLYIDNDAVKIAGSTGSFTGEKLDCDVDEIITCTSDVDYWFHTGDIRGPEPTFDPVAYDLMDPVYFPTDGIIKITFDEPIFRKLGGPWTTEFITTSTTPANDVFQLWKNGTSGTQVPFTGSISGQTVTLVPDVALEEYMTYTIRVVDQNGTIGTTYDAVADSKGQKTPTTESMFMTEDNEGPEVSLDLEGGEELLTVSNIQVSDNMPNNFYYTWRVKSNLAPPTAPWIMANGKKEAFPVDPFVIEDLNSSTEYELFYVADDDFGNVSMVYSETAMTDDTTAPQLLSADPVSGTTNVDVVAGVLTIKLTYNEKVAASTSTATMIVVRDQATKGIVKTYTTAALSIGTGSEIKDGVLYLKLSSLPTNGGALSIYVEMYPGCVVDQSDAANPWAGIAGSSALYYGAEDNRAPTVNELRNTINVTSGSPGIQYTGYTSNGNITVRFSENVKPGTGSAILYKDHIEGNYVLDPITLSPISPLTLQFDYNQASAIEVFYAGTPQVTFPASGTDVTINPTKDLILKNNPNAWYSILVNEGFAKDYGKNELSNLARASSTGNLLGGLTFYCVGNEAPYVKFQQYANQLPIYGSATQSPISKNILTNADFTFSEKVYYKVDGISTSIMFLTDAQIKQYGIVKVTDMNGNNVDYVSGQLDAGKIRINLDTDDLLHSNAYTFTISGLEDDKGTIMTTWKSTVKTTDGIVPIAKFNPEDEDEDVVESKPLTITFNEPIWYFAENGDYFYGAPFDNENIDGVVYLYEGGNPSNEVEFDATFDAATNKIIITPNEPLESGKTYTYGYFQGSVVDKDGNEAEGEEIATFTVRDYSAPEVEVQTIDNEEVIVAMPANGAEGVQLDAEMWVEFTEPIFVSTGSVVIRNVNGTIFETISASGLSIHEDDDQVLVIKHKPFDNYGEYFVEIQASAVVDESGNPNAAYTLPDFWVFTTSDSYKPQVTALKPVPASVDNPVTVNLEMTFNKNVEYNTDPVFGSFINVYKQDGTAIKQIRIQDVTILNNTVKYFNLVLEPKQSYYVRVEPNSLADENGNAFAGIMDNSWNFTTVDNTQPKVLATTPADNAVDVDAATTYSMTFDRDILAGAGKIVVRALSDGAFFEEVDITKVAISGKTVTFALTKALANSTEYYVLVPAGFVTNTAVTKDPFAGFNTVTDWNFTTKANTAPVVASTSPVEGSTVGTYIGLNIGFTMSESVVKGMGKIKVTRGTNVLELDVTSANVTLTDKVVTLNVPELKYFGAVMVDVPAGAFKDLATVPVGNVAKAWSFTIGDNVMADDCLDNVIPVDGGKCILDSIVLSMEFCEKVDNGATTRKLKVYSVLEVQGGLNVNSLFYETAITDAMITGNVVKVLVKGLADLTSYIVLIDKGAITDEAGNEFIGISDPTTWNFTTGDNTAPVATLVPANSTNNKNSFEVFATFTEPVQNVSASTIVVTGATTSSVTSVDNKTASLKISAVDGATVTVKVTNAIKDLACVSNNLEKEVTGTYTVGDNTAPTVAVTSAPADAMNTPNMFNVVLTFSEKVKGVAGALATSVGMTGVTTTDSVVYTVAFMGADETTGKLVLDNTMVSDMSQNANKLVTGINWNYKVGDFKVPTAVVVPGSVAAITGIEQVVTITFSEKVIVPVGGIVVTNGTAVITNVDSVYTVTIKGADAATVTMNLTALITDDSKNANKLAPATYTYTFVDRTPPTVIVYKPSAKDTLNSFDVTIQFSEPVTGVSTSTVTLMGTGAKMTLRTLATGLAYEATLTGADKAELILGFSNGIKDGAGNALVPVNFIYTIGDHTAPTVVATPDKGESISNKFEVALTFNEDVTGVASGIIVTNGTALVTGSGKEYKVAITGESMSMVTLYLTSAIKDLAGNTLLGKSFSYNVTGLVPIAAVQGQGNSSASVGMKLQVKGTVTAVAVGEGFFVQDASAARSGIWVAYTNVEGMKIGDGVIVSGTVAEDADVTTIVASAVEAATGTPKITPVKVTPTEAQSENYESVLVFVEGASASEANVAGEWNIYLQAADKAVVNDWMYAYKPVKGQYYDVTGIVSGRLDAFKIEPRMASDIVDLKATPVAPEVPIDFKVYPNPFNDHIVIDNNDILTRVVVVNIAGQRVIDIEYPNREIRTANLVSGVYVISLFTEDGIVKSERMIKR